MKILAVDDDPDILEILRLILRGTGFPNFTSATSANVAMRLINEASEPFDCFLIDIQMPGVTGIQLCRQIRKMAKNQAAPILMITAMMDKSYIDRAFLAGASDYVTKPIDLTELAAKMQAAQQAVLANRKKPKANPETPDPREQQDFAREFGFSDAFALHDVQGLIDLPSLENYLLQLSRGNLYSTSVIALHIYRAGELYARCSTPLFRSILANVAETTLAALNGNDCLLAYAGNGNFAGVLSQADMLQADEIEIHINVVLAGLKILDDDGKPLYVRVALGDPRMVGVMQSGKGAVNLLRRAIGDILWARPRSASDDLLGLPKGGSLVKSLFRRIN